ncbi:MAG: flagellin modification protein A [Bdellovibrionales bacterium]|nr:flagellin modification protein A [Bdellovibrionales bacterium]
MKLKDKVIVVTGGAGLLGQVFCKKISSEGGIAIIADIDLEKASKISSGIPNTHPVKLDITSKDSINDLISELQKKYGHIDGLVNNAYPRNKNYGKKFYDVTYADFCENLNLNIGGYFLTSQCFLNFFEKQGSGNVVSISSIYGVVAPKFEIYKDTPMTMPVEYAAIKSSLLHLTKYMAKYVAGKNIRVNCISPGGLLDAQPEAFLQKYKDNCLNKGMLNAEDITGSLIFLLSSDSAYINGQNIVVDDGFSI